jgi:lipoyl(octanoyl) transferase
MTARAAIPLKLHSPDAIAWQASHGLTPYEFALGEMERHVADIATGAPERVWLVEHPPIYTAGTSTKREDLIDPTRFPVFETGRGGQYTYHGPGQRVAYVMLDLKKRGGDVRAFVAALESWIISTLADFGIEGERREDRVGVWVRHASEGQGNEESKIAALGIRVRKGISFHGLSINLDPDLEHFSGIVPCGVAEHGVTSFRALGLDTTMDQLDAALRRNFEKIFGSTFS